jgi:quinol-cytochrome oxidoreductase complex cytochrome b subunit
LPAAASTCPTPYPHWFLTPYKKIPQKIPQKIFAGIAPNLIFALLSTEHTAKKEKGKGV